MADVDQTTPKLQSNPKGGRRRRNKEDETGADGISPKKEESTTSTAGPTKKNGWGEDAKAPMEAKEIAAPTMKDDPIAAEEDQSMIPSLDGEPAPKDEEVNLGLVIASAPAYRQTMPQLGDLERQQVRLPPVRDDTDLSLLTAVFTPAVEDEDVEWAPDQLFVSVMSDIQAEKDALLPPEEKDPGAP